MECEVKSISSKQPLQFSKRILFLSVDETNFSWMNVSAYLRSTSVYLKIIGTDNLNATSEYWPDIYYCGCSNKSECDYSLIIQDGPVDGSGR